MDYSCITSNRIKYYNYCKSCPQFTCILVIVFLNFELFDRLFVLVHMVKIAFSYFCFVILENCLRLIGLSWCYLSFRITYRTKEAAPVVFIKSGPCSTILLVVYCCKILHIFIYTELNSTNLLINCSNYMTYVSEVPWACISTCYTGLVFCFDTILLSPDCWCG
jgi:hypothetical protein